MVSAGNFVKVKLSAGGWVSLNSRHVAYVTPLVDGTHCEVRMMTGEFFRIPLSEGQRLASMQEAGGSAATSSEAAQPRPIIERASEEGRSEASESVWDGIQKGINALLLEYQTCGRCGHWTEFDRSQTDAEGRCSVLGRNPSGDLDRDVVFIDEDLDAPAVGGHLVTDAGFSCIRFKPRYP